jgi:hypothetical protein
VLYTSPSGRIYLGRGSSIFVYPVISGPIDEGRPRCRMTSRAALLRRLHPKPLSGPVGSSISFGLADLMIDDAEFIRMK